MPIPLLEFGQTTPGSQEENKPAPGFGEAMGNEIVREAKIAGGIGTALETVAAPVWEYAKAGWNAAGGNDATQLLAIPGLPPIPYRLNLGPAKPPAQIEQEARARFADLPRALFKPTAQEIASDTLDMKAPLLPFGQTGEGMGKATPFLSGETNYDQNYVTGFVSSAASSLPEFFGMPEPVESRIFREQNPWAGAISQFIGPGAAYTGWFKITQAGRVATMAEKAGELAAKGVGAAEGSTSAGIVAGSVRSMARFAPLELTRLGVGFTIWPENTDNMVGNALTNLALEGALGGVGGFFAAGGRAIAKPRVPSLIDKDIGLLPSFELRAMKDPMAQWEDGADPGALIAEKTNVALGARPGTRTRGQDATIKAERPFYDIGVSDDATGSFNQFFRPNSAGASAEELEKQGLDVRMFGGATKSALVPKEVQTQLLQGFGFKDNSDLAAAFVFPRLVKITSARKAGELAKAMDSAGAGLKWFSDQQALVATDGAGLHVFAKRVGRGAEVGDPSAAVRTKQYGAQGFSKGDYWLVGKTDRLDLVLPKDHKQFSAIAEDWAKMNVSYRPGLNKDFVNSTMDTVLAGISPRDWEVMRSETRASGIARIAARLKAGVEKELGVADSLQLKATAAHIWDTVIPTARKAVSDQTYSKMWGLLKSVVARADEINTQIIKGLPDVGKSPVRAILNSKNVKYRGLWDDLETTQGLVNSLSPEEANLIGNATQVAPGEMANAFEALSENGLISDRGKDVVRQLQDINSRFLDQYIKPALEGAGVDMSKMKWLDSYIMPRLWRGDYFQDIVKGDSNSIVYRVSGRSGAETQRISNHMIEAAKAKGERWAAKPMKAFDELAEGSDAFDLEKIYGSMVPPEAASDRSVQEIVMDGLRRARAEKPGIAKVRAPGTLKERSDLSVAPTTWTKDDIIGAISNHQKQLLRFAAQKGYYSRWESTLASWKESTGKPLLVKDLERKMTQFAGIQGNFARAQDAAMREVFGLPGRPLTKLLGASSSFMYQTMLGIFNPAFAVLNTLNPFMTTLPHLDFLMKAPTYKQLQYMELIPKLDAAGKVAGNRGVVSAPKLMLRGMKTLQKPDADDLWAFNRAVGDSVFSAQHYENFSGTNSAYGRSLKDAWKRDGAFEVIKEIANLPAARSEQFSRALSFSASWRFARDVLDLEPEQAYRMAKRVNEQAMYGYGLVDRPRIMTGPLGGMVGLFKNWTFHYINQMAEYAGVGVRDGVWSPLFWMMGTSAAIAGLGGTALKPALDGLAGMATDNKTMFEWLQHGWLGHNTLPWSDDTTFGDVLYFGLPAMIGASLQASASMPGSDITQDMTSLGNIVAWERAQQIGKWVGEMSDYQSATGNSGWTNDNLRAEGIGALMPRAVARIYSTTEQDAIISMRSGYPSVQGVSPVTKLLYAAGFNQVSVDRYYVAGRELFKDQDRQKSLIKNLGMAYADASKTGDFDEMQRTLDVTIGLGLPMDSVLQSAATRDNRSEGDSLSQYGQESVDRFFAERGGK